MRSVVRILLTMVVVVSIGVSMGAQGGVTSSISGTVVDADGGVVPGATVEVKDPSTGTSFVTVSNASGLFSVPSLSPSTYRVTISLQGFKSYVVDNLTVRLGTPVDVKAVLQVGGVEEVVQVRSGAGELINTQTPTVTATITGDQITKMPMASRNLVNAVAFLPGVNTTGTVRNSSFNGLPSSFVAINFDGINDNENLNKSNEGLFATISPRQDAIEAVTVTTAAAGADVGGHGAVQINFVTRSGSNQFLGSAYEYHRDSSLNTNYWFNANAGLPKNEVTLNQYGFRQGGPIQIPGVYNGRGKAFFFVNYEESRNPTSATRNRTIFNPLTQTGVMQYAVTSGGVTTTRQVDLFALARRNGIPVPLDPTVAWVLNTIRNSTGTTGLVTQQTDPNLQTYTWQSTAEGIDHQTVVRLDYNVNAHHQLSGTFNWQRVIRDPDLQNNGDVRFPGGTNLQIYSATRPLVSIALRSTISSNIVNELRGGARWSPSYFGLPATSGPQTFQDTSGYSLSLGGGVTGWTTTNSPSFRNAWNYQFDDSLTWQHGKHSIGAGGELYFGNITLINQQTVPSIGFGVADSDPASALFTTANFPGASTSQLTTAEAIFATLTGRVTSVGGQIAQDPATNQYVFLGPRRQEGVLNEYSAYIQDNWRATPTLTLSGGLRWGVQTPWSPVNDILSQATYDDACGISGKDANGVCRFFQPGASGGVTPQFTELTRGSTTYKTDWNNVAPTVGVAWRPNVQRGFLRGLLGDPEQATINAGYSVQYDRQGHGVFTGIFGDNPGSTLNVTRNESNGLLVPAGESWPVYLGQTSRLGLAAPCASGVVNAGCNPGSPSFPIPVRSGRADDLSIFDPDIEVGSARSYTIGFERSLSKDTAIDIRYVGTHGVNQWGTENYNERNLLENGFFDEFRLAMGNLQSSIASGCGTAGKPACSFAYRGPGTGTAPLPIYLAYLNGSKNAADAKAYTGSDWTNSTLVGRLLRLNPNVASSAQDLDGNATRRANALKAGLPANFFVLNPDVGDVTVETSHGYSYSNSLQISLRHRLSRGFQIDGNYVYALEKDSTFLGRHYGYALNPSSNVRHAFKVQWSYEVPIGQGHRVGGGLNRALDAIVGGWSFNGVGRIQQPVVNFGSVRLVNMTAADLQREYDTRISADPNNPGRQIVTMLPDDIILNTRRAFSTAATVSGYSDALGAPDPNSRYIAPAQSADCITLAAGDCAPRTLLIRAPWFTRVDVSLSKRIVLQGRTSVDIGLNVLNVFDNINFNTAANPGSGATIFQVSSAYSDLSNTFDPGGRIGEISLRLNW